LNNVLKIMNATISKFIKDWIKNIDVYVPGETKEGYIKLASNENNYGPSPKVVEILNEMADSTYRYPYKDAKVKQNIARYCKCDVENIIAGNGSDEIIGLVFKTFKSNSVGTFPTYPMYRIISQIFNGEYNDTHLNPDFSFDVERFIEHEKFRQANLVFLCSPNNPTGGIIGKDCIKKILDEGKITIVDEAYFEFYGETCSDLIKDYDNLIILRTFSKAFALAGLRAGYAIADEEIIKLLLKVKPPFNVNLLAQEATLFALSDIEYMKKNVAKIVSDRKILMTKLSEKFRVFPSEASFILVDVSPMTANEFFNKLFKERIIVRKLGKFGGLEGEYVRISVGTSGENKKLIEVLDRLN